MYWARQIQTVVLNGLEKLGIVDMTQPRGLIYYGRRWIEQLVKRVGRIQNLRDAVDEAIPAFAGLGILVGQHTDQRRKPNITLTNHNPGRFTLVHNGVIENYDELKEYLSDVDFKSQTDTEVAPSKLRDTLQTKKTSSKAFRRALKEIRGSFAFSLLDEKPGVLYNKYKSPLLVGVGEAST